MVIEVSRCRLHFLRSACGRVRACLWAFEGPDLPSPSVDEEVQWDESDVDGLLWRMRVNELLGEEEEVQWDESDVV